MRKEILEATVTKEIIGCEFNGLKKPKNAIDRANIALNSYNSDVAKYLIFEKVGKLYFDDKNITESILWLSKAINVNCIEQDNYIETLIYAASAYSETNSKLSVEYCLNAVQLAENKTDINELYYIELLGELAISYWVNKNYIQSFETFEKVVLKLIESKKENPSEYWIRLFKWTGTSIMYIASIQANEKIPKNVDGTDFIKPYQGIYTFNTKNLSDIYNSIHDPYIFVFLAIFADGINNIVKAYYWSLKAFDLSRKNGDVQVILSVSTTCSQYSLINFKIEEAFESYLLSSAISACLTGDPKEKYKNLDKKAFDRVLNEKPSANWNKAEETTMFFAIIPIFIIVLTDHLQNSSIKDKHLNSYLRMLKNYEIKASNPTMWNVIEELCRRIINDEIGEREMIDRANVFSKNDMQYQQMICILGVIFLFKESKNIIVQLLNILPSFTRAFNISTRSILNYVIVPFVKEISLRLIQENLIDNEREQERLKEGINSIDNKTINATQLIMQILVKHFDVVVIGNREEWLYEFKEI